MTAKRARRKQMERMSELLWGAAERPSRGPKPTLTLERVVRTGIEIADRDGLAALTMRRVADRLGFTTMALYRYVPGRNELIDLMTDMVVGSPPISANDDGGWRAKLERWTRANGSLYHQHPWILEAVMASPPFGPNRLAWLESAMDALSGTGLSGGEMLATIMLLDGHVRGAAQAWLATVHSEPRTGISPEKWGASFGEVLKKVLDADRYPTLHALVADGLFDNVGGDPAEQFEFGLQRVLDGLEEFIRARDGQARRTRRRSP